MRIDVGPVPADSALMWLAYARTVLAQVITRPGSYGVSLCQEDLAAFEAYLDQWELIATHDTSFHWVADVDGDKVRRLADTWVALATGMASEAAKRGYEMQPAEGQAFNQALAEAVMQALADEGSG